ncbi:MAG: IclR family transcriptional regulator [Candidatus Atribacteria bacterium]|nr:IclR family transcriptional regulator [Candidatus Atribacteria bacterium]
MKSKNRSDYYIHSIQRAIRILEVFSLRRKELSITELSRELNLHKSTVHRILVTLEDEHFIKKNQSSNQYWLGLKLFELGNIVKEHFEIRDYALPVMKDIASKTAESIDLNIIVDFRRVSIEKIESPHDIRRIIQLGKSLPLYSGGSGKAILAFLPENEIDQILKEENLMPLGPKTITDPIKLKEHLKEIRKQGYAISFEERMMGSASIAAPIFNHDRRVIASLSISGPINRFTKEKISKFTLLIKEGSQKISNSLGYRSFS